MSLRIAYRRVLALIAEGLSKCLGSPVCGQSQTGFRSSWRAQVPPALPHPGEPYPLSGHASNLSAKGS
jgi:hypothetical protein